MIVEPNMTAPWCPKGVVTADKGDGSTIREIALKLLSRESLDPSMPGRYAYSALTHLAVLKKSLGTDAVRTNLKLTGDPINIDGCAMIVLAYVPEKETPGWSNKSPIT